MEKHAANQNLRFRLHGMLDTSRANGPGVRCVIWFQGCPFRCPGCFNPDALPFSSGTETRVTEIADHFERLSPKVEGVTFSGGEPFSQPEALLALVKAANRLSLSVTLFSGYRYDQLAAKPLAAKILEKTDILIAGPYLQQRHLGEDLRGSDNQTIHLMSHRYSRADLRRIPAGEIHIDKEGGLTLSGVSPLAEDFCPDGVIRKNCDPR